MILTALSNAPNAAQLVLANDGASDTGYTLLDGADFGTPVWEHSHSGPRGTQGARAAQGKLPNRSVKLPIRVAGATKDQLAQRVSALVAVVDELRRFGGEVRMRSKAQTYAQSFDVLTATLSSGGEWSNRIEHRYLQLIGIELVCGPYLLGDWMDLNDSFNADTVNGPDPYYTARAGALTNLTVANGVLTHTANLTTENRLIWTRSGYTFGDHEATATVVPGATITSVKAGVVLAELDAQNYLEVYLDDDGTNTRARADKVVAGVRTNIGSTNVATRLAQGRRYTIRGRLEGNLLTVEWFTDVQTVNPVFTPALQTIALTAAEAALFGEPAEGRAGIVFRGQGAGAFIESFDVLPYTYRNPPLDTIDAFGLIPGDAPALGRVRMAPQVFNQGVFGMFAWAPRPRVRNLVEHGDFDGWTNTLHTVRRWSTAAVTGVLANAGTSLTLTDAATVGYGAKAGVRMLQVVTPATANSGVTYTMVKRFRRNTKYRASVWVRSSGSTTLVRARLGVNGDVASSTAVALTTGWVEHVVEWTPTADVTTAYLAVEVTAATATTFQIDRVVVTRGTTAPTYGSHPDGGGAEPPLAVLRAENYGAVIDPDLTFAAVANAIDGNAMSRAAVPGAGMRFTVNGILDVGLIGAEDYAPAGAVPVEFWLRVMLSDTFTGGGYVTCNARPLNESTEATYTLEFGGDPQGGAPLESVASGGNALWRMMRLGTIDLAANTSDSRYVISVDVVINAGTNGQQLAIDHLIAVPQTSRFLSPSGKPWGSSDGYPRFANVGVGVGGYRTVNPDLTSQIANEANIASPAGGIGGSMIEIRPGLFSFLALTSNRVPDDPTPSIPGTSETQTFPATHVGIRPRWHYLRP